MKLAFYTFPSVRLKCPFPSHPLDQSSDFQNLKGHSTSLRFTVKLSVKVRKAVTVESIYV